MITPWGTGAFSALVEQAPGLVAVSFGVYVATIVILAMVGSMHPDEKIRADAQKVLDRLLGRGEERAGS